MRKIISIVYFIIVIPVCAQQIGWSEQDVSPIPPKLNCVSSNIREYEGWIGGNNGTVLYTSNFGDNWIYRNNSVLGNNNINVITVLKSENYWLSGHALCAFNSSGTAYICKTTNQGINWTISYQKNYGRIRSIICVDSSLLYALGDPVNGYWTLLKSTNGGVSFDSSGFQPLPQIGSDTSNYSLFHYSVAPDVMMFGTSTGRIYRSIDNGMIWDIINLPFNNILDISLGHHPNGSMQGFQSGYAVGNGSSFTTNWGATWITSVLPGNGNISSLSRDIYSTKYCRGSQIYSSPGFTEQFSVEYVSPNGGNYTDMSLSTYFFESGTCGGWAVKDNGTISRYYIFWMGVKKISSEIPQQFSLFQNYPNPFNPSTKIKFEIPNSPFEGRRSGLTEGKVDVKLVIFDVLGQQIAELINQQLSPGTYEVEWSANGGAADYPSGIYFYTLKTESFNQTKRMVLVK